jgi:alpha-N-arabinofuranosidase
LTLTVVNPHATETRETEIVVRGASVQSGQSTTLSSTDIHAHNSIENPHGLEPRKEEMKLGGGRALVYSFPPASVTRLQMTLA